METMKFEIEISDKAHALIKQGYGWYYDSTDYLQPEKVDFTTWRYHSSTGSILFYDRNAFWPETNYYLRRKDCGYIAKNSSQKP